MRLHAFSMTFKGLRLSRGLNMTPPTCLMILDEAYLCMPLFRKHIFLSKTSASRFTCLHTILCSIWCTVHIDIHTHTCAECSAPSCFVHRHPWSGNLCHNAKMQWQLFFRGYFLDCLAQARLAHMLCEHEVVLCTAKLQVVNHVVNPFQADTSWTWACDHLLK